MSDAANLQLTLRSPSGNTHVLRADSTDTIETVKELIERITGFKPEDQRVIFAGQQLEDGRTLGDYDVRTGNTIHVTLKIGGAERAARGG